MEEEPVKDEEDGADLLRLDFEAFAVKSAIQRANKLSVDQDVEHCTKAQLILAFDIPVSLKLDLTFFDDKRHLDNLLSYMQHLHQVK